MKVKELKAYLALFDENTEVMIRNSWNPCGNIQDLDQVEASHYGFFGSEIPCVILNSSNAKEIETDDEENVIPFLPASS